MPAVQPVTNHSLTELKWRTPQMLCKWTANKQMQNVHLTKQRRAACHMKCAHVSTERLSLFCSSLLRVLSFSFIRLPSFHQLFVSSLLASLILPLFSFIPVFLPVLFVCELLSKLSVVHTRHRKVGWHRAVNWKRCERKRSWHSSTYYSHTSLEGLRKTIKNLRFIDASSESRNQILLFEKSYVIQFCFCSSVPPSFLPWFALFSSPSSSVFTYSILTSFLILSSFFLFPSRSCFVSAVFPRFRKTWHRSWCM